MLLDPPKLACNWTDSVLVSAKSAGDLLKKQNVRSNEVSVLSGAGVRKVGVDSPVYRIKRVRNRTRHFLIQSATRFISNCDMQVFQSEMIIVRCDNRTEICTCLYNGSCMLYIQLVRPRLSFSPGPYYPGNRKLNEGCLFLYRNKSISGTNPRRFSLLPLVYEHLFKGPEPSDMRRSAYQIGAARRSFATLQKPRRNRRFHV